MAFSLPQLPYSKEALEPYISEKTLSFHYDKHHQTYVTTLNKMIENTELNAMSLEDIILKSYQDSEQSAIFNNAAQVWNHTFYWNCLKPNSTVQPCGILMTRINQDFGSFDAFAKDFKQAALSQFGSGWAWLIERDGALEIMKTGNADLPMVHGAKALLTCDVWEHAYYLDYQNRRAEYIDQIFDHLINWEFVTSQLA